MSVPQCCVCSLSLPASLALATPQGSREPRVRSSNSATASLRGTRRHGVRSVSDHASFLLTQARGPLPRSVRFVRQQIVSANPVRPRSDRSQLFLVNTGPRRSRVHALLVCRTPGISCERPIRSTLVCFIPLLDRPVIPPNCTRQAARKIANNILCHPSGNEDGRLGRKGVRPL